MPSEISDVLFTLKHSLLWASTLHSVSLQIFNLYARGAHRHSLDVYALLIKSIHCKYENIILFNGRQNLGELSEHASMNSMNYQLMIDVQLLTHIFH